MLEHMCTHIYCKSHHRAKSLHFQMALVVLDPI